MKILITGAAGYIGSALAKLLIQRNIDVTLIDNYYMPSSLKEIDGVPILNRDIRDTSLDLSEYSVLVHLAAICGIATCEQQKEEAFSVNVKGTFNLLKKFHGRVIFASTSAVYGEARSHEIDEEHPVEPRGYYGITKTKAEDIVRLQDSYSILRFSNIYGKGLLCKRTVADLFIENALKGLPLQIHGDGKQRRDFVNLNDVLRAYWMAIHSDISDTFNIGGNEALNINEICELVYKNYLQLFGGKLEIKHIPIDCGVVWKDFNYLSKKAKTALGYEPSYSVSDEIRRRLNAYSKTQKVREKSS